VNQKGPRLIIGAALAVAVPAAVLHFSAADERLAAGLSASPFGWPRVLVAHLVTALPLGLIVAGWVRSLPTVRESARGFWVALGLIAAGLAATLCPGIGEAVVASEFGPVPLLIMRSLLAFGLVLPWCVWAIDSPSAPLARPSVMFGLGLGLAVLPCGLYAEAVTAARTEQARDLLSRERVVKAEMVLTGLCELGSDRPIGKQSAFEVRTGVAKLIPKMRQAAERPLPASALIPARIERAGLLIRLDRLDEAAALLRPLTPDDNTATLLLATVYRDQARWSESDALYTTALEKLLPMSPADVAARNACLTAFEGLAFNAREDRRPADAERVLKWGLEALPSEAAFFHFQLGRHYADGGRPGLALEHLRTAATLAPAKFQAPADTQIRQLRTHTPGCLLVGFP
jgi:hypothetical protein